MSPENYVSSVYQLLFDRSPTPHEQSDAERISPKELIRQLLASDELQGEEGFRPYLIHVPDVGDHPFDFLIADALAASWYDGWASWDGGPETGWCLSRLKPGMTALDCGAHHGMMALAFAKAVGPTGRVIAWEAWPKAARIAVCNLALNACGNAAVRAVALGEHKSEVAFGLTDSLFFETGHGAAEVRLPTMPLDDELPAGRRVDFVKIDVEGSELPVLRGARNLLAQRPMINLEIHNFMMQDRRAAAEEILRILSPLNYSFWLQEVADWGEVSPIGRTLDPDRLAACDNPHLFCEPG